MSYGFGPKLAENCQNQREYKTLDVFKVKGSFVRCETTLAANRIRPGENVDAIHANK